MSFALACSLTLPNFPTLRFLNGLERQVPVSLHVLVCVPKTLFQFVANLYVDTLDGLNASEIAGKKASNYGRTFDCSKQPHASAFSKTFCQPLHLFVAKNQVQVSWPAHNWVHAICLLINLQESHSFKRKIIAEIFLFLVPLRSKHEKSCANLTAIFLTKVVASAAGLFMSWLSSLGSSRDPQWSRSKALNYFHLGSLIWEIEIWRKFRMSSLILKKQKNFIWKKISCNHFPMTSCIYAISGELVL